MKHPDLKIGPYYCGKEFRPLVVAELSANHGNSESIIVQSIEAARDCSVDFFKIQIFDAEKMARPGSIVEDGKWAGQKYEDLYRKTQMPKHLIELAFTECKRQDLPIFASVFEPEDVERAVEMGSCAIKIASPEITHHPLIEEAARSGVPVILSLGAATRQDMIAVADLLARLHKAKFMFMHCVSEYPCPASHSNLLTIPLLEEFFQVPVGYSDHTLGTWAAVVATTLGASMIEKHFTLNSGLYSEDVDFSADPDQMARLVNDVVRAKASLGSPRIPTILDEPVSSHKRSRHYLKRPWSVLDDGGRSWPHKGIEG